MSRTRYAIVGTGGRSAMFINALRGPHAAHNELVALCDINPLRMDFWNSNFRKWNDQDPLPTYTPDQLETMIREQRIDALVVCSIDRTHHQYIVRGMEAGCDVITEKPMTVDAAKCQAIIDAQRRTGRRLRVTFNYRYAPRNSQVKRLLMDGVIGQVRSVHFEWLLDTRHGADYFRRWHRDKRNSGGLMVHKATHHFDLVNWWLAAEPTLVMGLGDLVFYGRENAEQRGVTRFYDRGTGHPNAAGDPFAMDLQGADWTRRMYHDCEAADGYRRDQSVFGDGISIEDDMSVLVRYHTGSMMSYHLHAYAPWEGYRIAFNGTGGRLEYEVQERSYVSGAEDDANRPDIRDAIETEVHEPVRLLVRPLWGKPLEVPVAEQGGGGHGGGDVRLLADLFEAPQPDPLGRAADHRDGARSILTGIAANQSFATGLPVDPRQLVRGLDD